jgi:uncharacterized membrane protein YesL
MRKRRPLKHPVYLFIILIGSFLFVCRVIDYKDLLLFFTVPITLWYFLGLYMFKISKVHVPHHLRNKSDFDNNNGE